MLAIVPATQGFGFAVLERRGRLVSWGCATSSRMSDMIFLQRVEHLADKYRVRAIALEDPVSFKRLERARRRTAAAASYATTRRIGVCIFSKETIASHLQLSSSATQFERAQQCIAQFPELAEFLPDPKRIWDPQRNRYLMFRAVALAAAAGCVRTR